ERGGLGSPPCARTNANQVHEQMAKTRAPTKKPITLNFFCHTPPALNNAREARWRERLAPYYRELAIDPAAPVPSSNRTAFDSVMCDVVEATKPEVVSAGRPRARAAARPGRGAGSGSLPPEVGRATSLAGPRHARRPVDQGARRRGARADARTRRVEELTGLRARDAQARPPGVGDRDARGRDREFLPGLRQPRLRRLESGGIGGLKGNPG